MRVTGTGSERDRLERLAQHLFNDRHLQFAYDNDNTLTAHQAFARQGGNCVSFSNLFVALARSIDIPAQAALFRRRGNPEIEGDLMVFNTHMAAGWRDEGVVQLFDFFRLREERKYGYRLIDDLWNTGVYLSNRGTTALRRGELDDAERFLGYATRIAPRFAPAHGNLGVVLRRRGDIEGALVAHLRALELEPFHPQVLGNARRLIGDIADLWEDGRRGEPDAAGTEATLAPVERRAIEGLRELARGNREGALARVREARRIDPSHPAPRLAEAIVHLVAGRRGPAGRDLRAAAKLSPDDPGVRRYRRVYDRLVHPDLRGGAS